MGTDTIAEVAIKIKKFFYINIQGNEPTCNTAGIKKIVLEAIKFPNEIINGYTEITDKAL
jgi:CMP-2-keto-3-deoxyoctulosonic acid synthetase